MMDRAAAIAILASVPAVIPNPYPVAFPSSDLVVRAGEILVYRVEGGSAEVQEFCAALKPIDDVWQIVVNKSVDVMKITGDVKELKALLEEYRA